MWIVIYSNYTRRYADIISKFPENINEDNFVINPEADEYNEVMGGNKIVFWSVLWGIFFDSYTKKLINNSVMIGKRG